MGSYYTAHAQELIDLYRTLAYKSNMETLVMILTLFTGGQNDQSIDPASLVMKQLVKGVYDETRVETVATFEEKYAPDFVDPTRILE